MPVKMRLEKSILLFLELMLSPGLLNEEVV